MPVRGCQWPLRKLGVWVVLCSQSLTRPWCSSRAVGESQFRQYRACRTGRTMACKRSGVQIPSAPPRNPRSDDTALVQERLASRLVVSKLLCSGTPNSALPIARDMWAYTGIIVAANLRFGSSPGVQAGDRRLATVRQMGASRLSSVGPRGTVATIHTGEMDAKGRAPPCPGPVSAVGQPGQRRGHRALLTRGLIPAARE
jgi:hypothetical protein